MDYKIKGKDVLTHIVHRHEPGVAIHPAAAAAAGSSKSNESATKTELVKVIDETDDLIILDKPGTLPIHPCGGYHLNSLTSILEGEEITASGQGQSNKKYFNIHRLDRLTSGLVILAKSSEVAKHWSQCIRQRDCQKYYLARVRGKFPENLAAKACIHRIQATSEDGTPRDGEWVSTPTDDPSTAIETARRQNAQGYWITEASSGAIRNDVSLSDLSNASGSVDDWLLQVENVEQNKSGSSMLWLHLAF